MAIDLKEVASLGAEFLLALPALLLIKFTVVCVLARIFGLGLRAAVLAGLLLTSDRAEARPNARRVE